ncbi:hypothetical protein H4R26_002705 [Coemansia thaxteri]|uniref:Ubiquitin-like domain-containing protein n=1 Tax=Coemansia thaxteri TaxID=2663907 RepID=A0A9W8BJB9_9FUNG|nr:hypothetical protein H4R26_002705 [Coemansia thaxteri]
MPSDSSFFDATLAQLSQLSASRTLASDSKVPSETRYPTGHFDFKMPTISETAGDEQQRTNSLTLTFKTLKAPVNKFTLQTSDVRTVAQVKRQLSRMCNVPVSGMRLVLGGKGLVDSKLIGDYAIQSDSVIQIISGKPTTSEEPVGGGGAVDSVNPLSSVLDQESKTAVLEDSPAVLKPAENRSDERARDRVAISQATREVLQNRSCAFRVGLRELIHGHIADSGQARAVEDLVDKAFDSKI